MKTIYQLIYIFISVAVIFSCGKKEKNYEKVLHVIADETLYPVIDDQIPVYESHKKYRKVNIDYLPEGALFKKMLVQAADAYIVTRDLSEQERDYFLSKKLLPDTTLFAEDAIALIASPGLKDTLLTVEQVKALFLEKKSEVGVNIVFDNQHSGIVRYIQDKFNILFNKKENVFVLNNSKEVIEYVCNSQNAIGFISVNWLTQTPKELRPCVKKVSIIRLKAGEKSENFNDYFYPWQSETILNLYPFTREVIHVDCSGNLEKSQNFVNFLCSEIGQRIVQKAGLSPRKIPPRIINVSKKQILIDSLE